MGICTGTMRWTVRTCAYFIELSRGMVLLYNMMKISKYGNYEKTSFDLPNVERMERIIGQNNDTRNFARFEKQKASLYESLISHLIYLTILSRGVSRYDVQKLKFILVITSNSYTQTGIRQILFLLTLIAKLSKDLIMLLRASFVSFFLAKYLNASRQIYISHPKKKPPLWVLAGSRERERERAKSWPFTYSLGW